MYGIDSCVQQTQYIHVVYTHVCAVSTEHKHSVLCFYSSSASDDG